MLLAMTTGPKVRSLKLSPSLPNTWGGKRDGAGRPKSSIFVSHLSRPSIEKRKCPLQVTLRLRSNLPSFQSPEVFSAFEKACARARRFGIRIIHYNVQAKSIQMICEAKKSEELERSFKSLNTTLAIAVKKRVKEESGKVHEGPVFLGRYQLKVLTYPDEVKVAMREVLSPAIDNLTTDSVHLSSAIIFEKWKALMGPAFKSELLSDLSKDESARSIPLKITATPQFWLNQAGWLKSEVL